MTASALASYIHEKNEKKGTSKRLTWDIEAKFKYGS